MDLYSGSFYLGRWFQEEVRVHWTMILAVGYFILRSGVDSFAKAMLWVIVPYVLLFGSILAHEFGHILAMRYFRIPTYGVILWPLGGLAFGGEARRPKEEFVVAAAGPFVTLVLMGLGHLLAWGSYQVGVELVHRYPFSKYIWIFPYFGAIFHQFAWIQLYLFVFNVAVMAFPMDGGRMLFAILWYFKGPYRALILSAKIAIFFAFLMVGFAFYISSMMLGLIAFFIWSQASAILQNPELFYQLRAMSSYAPISPSPSKDSTSLLSQNPEEMEVEDLKRAIDLLLDKIERNGIHSLSQEEREFLFKANEIYSKWN
ncbi:MAG: hypothetical protein D6805_00360 [Planctomycetota bacterium]|nr:MAG: hypothetical protein D6805_00360 [Planctomycetota bacterium]